MYSEKVLQANYFSIYLLRYSIKITTGYTPVNCLLSMGNG